MIAALIAVLLAWIACSKHTETDEADTGYTEASAPRKIIWVLWMQGWDNETPWLVWEVRRSWERLNRGWRVIALDAHTLGSYLDMSTGSAIGRMAAHGSGVPLTALSDIIRLALLSTHGGVWADATMLCMTPLDEWVYDSLLPCGLWMYHGRDWGDGPASCFIVSTRHSYILRAWALASFDYWRARNYRGSPDEYFWMDSLFAHLRRSDAEFQRQWRLVPYLWCDAFGQAHMLAGRVEQTCTQEVRELLMYSPPYALKLSWHVPAAVDGPSGFEHTCLYQAVVASQSRQRALPSPISEAALRLKRHLQWHVNDVSVASELPDLPTRIVVVADCACTDSIRLVIDMCIRHGAMPLVYDKCGFCSLVPDGVFCRPLPNTGRDLGTFFWFVSRYYHVIPDSTVVYLTAGNMMKHNRAERLDALLGGNTTEAGRLAHQSDFTLAEYEGAKLRRADPPQFRAWFERHVGPWEPDRAGACWNAIVRTTGSTIRRRPRTTFINVYNELILADNIEAVHYAERFVHALLCD